MSLTGECFCGAITYQIDGRLRDARSCHCSRCRKAFSAQASAYAEVEPGTFHWTSGEALLSTYSTGQGFGLQFCSRLKQRQCGLARRHVSQRVRGAAPSKFMARRRSQSDIEPAWPKCPSVAGESGGEKYRGRKAVAFENRQSDIDVVSIPVI